MKNLFDLKGKVILITGGSGHLGKAMAHALAEYGATLILASRNIENNKKLCNELTSLYHNQNIFLEIDLEDKEEVTIKIRKIINECGKIDILINNSYYGASKKFHEMTYEDWSRGIQGSVDTVFLCTRAVIDEMLKKKNGKIINIASMYGINAPNVYELYEGSSCEKYYNPINYGVGKAGIIQFTKYIAAVYGKEGIICNSISPGPFPSLEIQKNKTFIERLTNKVPLKRIGKPEDLKGAIVFLCSDSSNYINGHNLVVDGGWTIW
ncbi:SDR family oxidoreductase [Fusobacterium canifelinum]|uniref:SDR family oxidoreductase n=1 Tax=Fusobacterium canifelinum TaxID=285729 RepID=A0A3P1UZR1_9FUSO|nr:SDR family oxidoreductase [Fusobacterium canifelinum]RRD27108.1 SDR family oxidoreductase [Fusobacterium canifelinum]